jgi:pyridoxal 5'-phosphate synthase pdxT subunit
MLKLLHIDGLYDVLREFGERKPGVRDVRGSDSDGAGCEQSGAGKPGPDGYSAPRDGYGRQIDSRVVAIEPSAEFERRVGEGKLEAVFIRAPIIREARDGVKVLAEYYGDPVLIEQGVIWRRRFIRS